jgi:hypothetical protein
MESNMPDQATARPFSSSMKTLAWCLFGVLLLAYGLLAFDSGAKLSPLINETQRPDLVSTYILENISGNEAMQRSEEVGQVIPEWLNLIASLRSGEYAYGPDSIMETEIYYYSMTEPRRKILSTHMMLGVVILVTGFLQFWPSFRRRNRRFHRYIGGVYILAAITSMTLSGLHLLHSGPENTYDNFVFHIGLWIMLLGVLLSLSMAMWALYKKNYAHHLGWQALGFGFFMTAPLQRIDWIVLSVFSGDRSFNEMNILVNAMLFVQAALVGYVLFYINRSASTLKSDLALNSQEISPSFINQCCAYFLVAGLSFLTVYQFIISPGLASNGLLVALVPASAAQWHGLVFGNAVLPWLAASATSVILIAGMYLQILVQHEKTPAKSLATLVTVCGFILSLIFLNWAFQLGLPTHAHSLAGSAYAVTGVLLFLFVSLYASMLYSGLWARAREFLWFVILLSAGSALGYVSLISLSALAWVPNEYVEQGDGYELAMIIGVFFPVLIAFMIAVYSQETRRYAVH